MHINQNHNTELKTRIVELFHLAKTALYNTDTIPTKYDRMIYVKKELIRSYPETIAGLSPKTIWFTIQDILN